MDDVFEKKDEIADIVKSELAQVMEGFGSGILKALVTDIEPDARVTIGSTDARCVSRVRQPPRDQRRPRVGSQSGVVARFDGSASSVTHAPRFAPDGHPEWEHCPHAQSRGLWDRALRVVGNGAFDLVFHPCSNCFHKFRITVCKQIPSLCGGH